jgi:regulator of replication initiation timing
MENKMTDRPHPDNPNSEELDVGKYVRMNSVEEENKKLKVEIERLKSLLHGSALDLKQAEEVRLKLAKEISRLSEIVDYLNDRIRLFNNGI